ncbi:MAG: hypothetical protein ACXWQ5_07580 [Ktedonobacterales bacterium]
MMRMMRSRTRAGALFTMFLTCAVLLSGCFHLDQDMKLNGDGSGSYTLSLGLTEALVGLAGDTFTKSMDEHGQQVKQQGGDYRHFDQDGYSVWVFTRPFKSVSDLNALLHENPTTGPGGSVSVPAQDILAVTEAPGFFVNSFRVTGHISLKDLSDTSSAGSGIDMSSYLKDARESVSITMPGWITSYEKGGEVHGNTVTYTAHYNEEATIDVVGGAVNPTAIYIAAGIGLLALLLIGGVIFWRRRQQHPGAAEPALVPAGAASGSPWGDMPSMSAPTIPSSLTPAGTPPSAPDQTPTP